MNENKLATKSNSGRASPPRYEYPLLPLLGFGIDLVLGRRRSFVQDSRIVAAHNRYPRRHEGIDNVPRQGSFLLVANHYARTGLQPFHWGMIITATLAGHRPHQPHIYWLIIGEWWGRRLGPLPIPRLFYRWIFSRTAYIYDLIALPVQPSAAMKRAAVFRKLLKLADRGPIGLTPEGGGPGRLRQPPEGSGLLIHALSRRSLPIIPLGVYEEDDKLVFRFGEPFELDVPKQVSRAERDQLVQEQVIAAIARLLPQDYLDSYARSVLAARGQER